MKKVLSLLSLLLVAISIQAQNDEVSYYLPKTELHFQVLVEKSVYTPGEFARYSERFLRKAAQEESTTTYRLVGISMYTTSVPDADKQYTIALNKKTTIFTVDRASNGVLMAINAKRKDEAKHEHFVAAPKAKAVNPHDYMSEEILTAGSVAKMAELTARDIYDIRAARNDLNRGEAEFMPSDGAQMRFMLANLAEQEAILTQTFQGVTVCDTVEYDIPFLPEIADNGGGAEPKVLLFRLSQYLGLVDDDDMAGEPYYIAITDQHIIPTLSTAADGDKHGKDDGAITVNMPGKIRVDIIKGNKTIAQFETYAAQYGALETLPSSLFSKKTTTHVQLNPVTGNVEYLESEPLD